MSETRCIHCDKPITWAWSVQGWFHVETDSKYCDLSGTVEATPE